MKRSMNHKPIKIKKINKHRFDIYMLFTRHPKIEMHTEELEHYSNEDDSILGLILFDYIDMDYNYLLMCRDENKQFRPFEVKVSYPNIEKVREILISKIRWHTLNNLKIVNQKLPKQGVDLFNILVEDNKLHPYFVKLRNHDQFLSSKRTIIEIGNHLDDIDGNFIEQFQTLNGFDSRIWELYLFASLIEQKFRVLREYDRPDFIVEKNGVQIGIEAVIVSRRKENSPSSFIIKEQKTEAQLNSELENDMPLRFGSTLFSKVSKKYWELQYLKDKPLLIAIADFHDDLSMTWSFTALLDYLYGKKHVLEIDKSGNQLEKIYDIEDYVKSNGQKIPAGFFFQEGIGNENISGVLFTACGTIGKFTRMGIQAKFGIENQSVLRIGTKYDHNDRAFIPAPFCYTVDENATETWSEGLNLFHNPNALNKIDKELFPEIAHHEFIDGRIISYIPDFHPYSSININIKSVDAVK